MQLKYKLYILGVIIYLHYNYLTLNREVMFNDPKMSISS